MEELFQSDSFLQGSVTDKMKAIYQSESFLQGSITAKSAFINIKLQKTQMDSCFKNMKDICISIPDFVKNYRNAKADYHEKEKALENTTNLMKTIAVNDALNFCGFESEIPLSRSDSFLQACFGVKMAKENYVQSEKKYLYCAKSFNDLERQYRECYMDYQEAFDLKKYYSETLKNVKDYIGEIAIHASLKCCGIDPKIPLPSFLQTEFPSYYNGGLIRRYCESENAWDEIIDEEERKAGV